MLTDALPGKHFELRGAIDNTIEIYCDLCDRVIFEIHEDTCEDGFSVARQHWKEFHGTVK